MILQYFILYYISNILLIGIIMNTFITNSDSCGRRSFQIIYVGVRWMKQMKYISVSGEKIRARYAYCDRVKCVYNLRVHHITLCVCDGARQTFLAHNLLYQLCLMLIGRRLYNIIRLLKLITITLKSSVLITTRKKTTV